MKKLTVKQILFLLVMLLLILPALQRYFIFVAEKPLSGAFVKQEPPNFSDITVSSWMDGSFQADFSTRLEPHIGFHNTLLRLFNQLEYSLFREANAEGVIVGKAGKSKLFRTHWRSLAKAFLSFWSPEKAVPIPIVFRPNIRLRRLAFPITRCLANSWHTMR
jgi:hypothetical protein